MDIAGKRLLVVGGAGLIGSHVVEELLKTDVGEVVVYDNFCRGTMENLRGALEDPRVSVFPHGGDILHRDILERAMEGIDGVFHLAALWILQCHEYPETAFQVNVRGTFNVIMAAMPAEGHARGLFLLGLGLRRRPGDPHDRGPCLQQLHLLRGVEDRRRALLQEPGPPLRAELGRAPLHERLRPQAGL